MKDERMITRKNILTGELKTMTVDKAYKEITKTLEGQNLCDEWAVENKEIFEDILEGAGTLEIDDLVYSYNVLLLIKRVPGILLNRAVNNSLPAYKMDGKDFNLWLKYLATHPRKPSYASFRKFKEKKEFEEMCQKANVKKESLCDTVFTRQFK